MEGGGILIQTSKISLTLLFSYFFSTVVLVTFDHMLIRLILVTCIDYPYSALLQNIKKKIPEINSPYNLNNFFLQCIIIVVPFGVCIFSMGKFF